ncbi:hypothetical protein [Actinomadura alba]|nr:hypothetical protein [Actinomadura alba]
MAVSVHDATPLISGNSYTTPVDATRLRQAEALGFKVTIEPVA